jgi:hypothetical protein
MAGWKNLLTSFSNSSAGNKFTQVTPQLKAKKGGELDRWEKNPLTYSGTTDGGSVTNKIADSIWGTAGEKNPYSAPDQYGLQGQAPTADYSFLQNADYGNSPSYRYLLNATPSTNNRTDYYNNLMSTINAPSSVDTVREDLYGQQYQNLLTAADQATNEAMGSGIGGYARRGLINPNAGGVSSDIASVGLANIVSQGATTKSNAALTLQQNLLDLQKARETAAQNAALTGYTTEASADQSANQMENSNQQLYSNLRSSDYNSGANRTQSDTQLYANLLKSNAELQQARDIANATNQSNLYNAGQQNKANTTSKGAVASIIGMFCFDPMTPIKMEDGNVVCIVDLGLGDKTLGGEVLSIRRALTNDMHEYKGVFVTGSHCVKDVDGKWKYIRDAIGSKKLNDGNQEIVSIVTSKHRIYVGDIEFEDEGLILESDEKHIEELNSEESV